MTNRFAGRSFQIAALLLAPMFLLMTACTDLTGRGAAPLDKSVGAPVLEHPRVGHVYCMRGWLGIFSEGMDALAHEIDIDLGATAVSVANEEHYRLQDFLVEKSEQGLLKEPLVLLGHSYGADDMIRVAQTLKEHNIQVDLLVLLDPVTPPKIPSNVKRAYCVYKSHPLTDWYPAWRGVPAEVADPAATPLENIDLAKADLGWNTERVGHVNIEKTREVHVMAMQEIAKVCPYRAGVTDRRPVPTAGELQPIPGEYPATAGNPTRPLHGPGPTSASPN